MKVMSIIGTRPEIIKMSEIIKQLDKVTDHILIHTGQNYDFELNEIFYKDLNLRHPDHTLLTKGDSLAETLGNIMFEIEKMLNLYEPDAVVILGDTNSALSGLIVKRMKIPLFHLEAGNRCFDDNVPEEINRRILDHISDVNMVYTENQRRNLLSEGIAKDRLFLMGSPMHEVITQNITKINNSDVLIKIGLEYPESAQTPYFLVSIHRDENVESEDNLNELMKTLDAIYTKYGNRVIVTTHPRLKKKLENNQIKGIEFMKPFGFLDYCKLQMNAICVISDSGTIAEESAILGFPAIIIRNAQERIEAVDSGSILMSGVKCETILKYIDIVEPPITTPSDYMIPNTSKRVAKAILGYTPYVNRYVWHK